MASYTAIRIGSRTTPGSIAVLKFIDASLIVVKFPGGYIMLAVLWDTAEFRECSDVAVVQGEAV